MTAMARTVWMDVKQALLILLFVPFVLFSGVAPTTMLQDTGDGLAWVLCQDDHIVPAVFNADGELEPVEDQAHDPCPWSQVGGHQLAVAANPYVFANMVAGNVPYGVGQASVFQPAPLNHPIARGPPVSVI